MIYIDGVAFDLSKKPAWSVDWRVIIDGKDKTSGFSPYLINISVSDKEGTSSDSCNLTLDDTDGSIDLDMEGCKIQVLLNRMQVFEGVIETARSTGSRGGGRIIPVTAKGFDTRGKAKEVQSTHLDDGTLGDFLKKVGKAAGIDVNVDPSLAKIKRDYFSADYESLLDVGERIAREVNGTFKVRGDKAVLVPRGKTDLPKVYGTVGPNGNVLTWDIAPFTGRPAFTKAKTRHFDRNKAEFLEKEVDIILQRHTPEATNVTRMAVADPEQAQIRAEGRKGEAERNAGAGSVMLDLEPSAQAEAVFVLQGARRQIDNSYRITSVEHKADRNGGATTGLELKEPGAK